MKPWVIVQHVPHEGPGLVAEALAGAGSDWAVLRADLGEPLPGPQDVTGLAGLVVMGGPMGVHDCDEHPWLAAERDLLAAAVAADLVVLGVCLGAQQLALALGAAVRTGDGPEIGPGQVVLSPAGLADPVLGPTGSPLPCLHWHGDTFTVPPGAVRLAGSDRYRNQAFRAGSRAYGLQFHVEVDAVLAAGWAPHLPTGVTLGVDEQAAVAAAGRGVLDRLVALAAPGA